MASVRKKQDEKNLKILRELVSTAGNKECFDCQQKGPTYVNMTIGSFVCTKCSGMLRGLTPPHRIKSISMATFSEDEINFIRERGNEFCRAIWLGLIPQNFSSYCKDEQKMKDLMSAKYELKKYYLDPVISNKFLNKKPLVNSEKSISNTHDTKSVSSSVPSLKYPLNEDNSKSSTLVNFVADFTKAPPAPTTPAFMTTKLSQPVNQPLFADFDNNPIFNSSTDYQTPFSSTKNNQSLTSSSEDRYAALKDLDSMMKQVNLNDKSESVEKSLDSKNNDSDNFLTSSTLYSTDSSKISNPFIKNDWQLFDDKFNKDQYDNNNFQQINASVNNTVLNPFESTQESNCKNDFFFNGNHSQSLSNMPSNNLFQTSTQPWQPVASCFKVNPFTVGSTFGKTTDSNSKNPFL